MRKKKLPSWLEMGGICPLTGSPIDLGLGVGVLGIGLGSLQPHWPPRVTLTKESDQAVLGWWPWWRLDP